MGRETKYFRGRGKMWNTVSVKVKVTAHTAYHWADPAYLKTLCTSRENYVASTPMRICDLPASPHNRLKQASPAEIKSSHMTYPGQ